MEIMQILYFSSRNVGSNAIFTIFASGGPPARLQSQRQLQSMLLTGGLPVIPAGMRSVSERQRDFEKCVFLESQGGLTRNHYKTRWNTYPKITTICPQKVKSELQRRKIWVRRVIWRRFLSTNVGSAEKRVSVLESQTPFFKTMHISLGVSPKMKNTINKQTSLLVAARARILKRSEISIALARVLSYFFGKVGFSKSVCFVEREGQVRKYTPPYSRNRGAV